MYNINIHIIQAHAVWVGMRYPVVRKRRRRKKRLQRTGNYVPQLGYGQRPALPAPKGNFLEQCCESVRRFFA